MAQSNVYSLNIVGYANVAAPLGFSFQSNPLDAGVTNGANEVIPNTGQWDGCEIHEWTGVGYKVSVFDSTQTTGFTDRNFVTVNPPLLTSGKGYLFNNQLAAGTITYVGNVRVGTNTLNFPISSHVYAVGSPLPLAGGISTSLGLVNTAGALDGAEIQTALANAAGQITGFKVSVFDSGQTTGFSDRNFTQVAEPQIAIGQGFFLNSQAASAITWKQVLLNQ